MKVLKGFALGILGFLLFLSLSILGIAIMLNYTILNPDFVSTEIDKIDTSELIKPLISEPIISQIPPETQFLAGAVDKTIDDLEPWIKEETNMAIHKVYSYLLGKSQSLSITISLETLKETLRDNAWDALIQSPPPEFSSVPPAVAEQMFDQIYREFAGEIPSSLEFDQSLIPPDMMPIIEQTQLVLGYFQAGFYGLIGFTALVILLIVLIHRQVRGSTRTLGTTSLIVGALTLVEIFLTSHFILPVLNQLPGQLGIPLALQTWLQRWLPQLLNDFLNPLQVFSIGLIAAGIVLLIISYVYKPRTLPDQQPTPALL